MCPANAGFWNVTVTVNHTNNPQNVRGRLYMVNKKINKYILTQINT